MTRAALRSIASVLCGPLALWSERPGGALLLIVCGIALAILNPIGGVLLWVSSPLLVRSTRRLLRLRMLAGGAAFLGLYLVVMLVAVPGVARLSGRVALPCFPSGDVPVRAASIGYCLLGRNYLRPEYVPALEGVVREVEAKHGGVISYLDAGFPFAGVPLPPHLSHDDGRELDVAFRYRSATTHAPTASGPSPIGYWVYEAPRPSEPRPCSDAEGWLRWDLPWLQWLGASCELDEEATRDTIMSFAAQPEVEKILIEQHLIERLKITSNKVRFQGCRAARHDDHFHVHFRRDTNQARQ